MKTIAISMLPLLIGWGLTTNSELQAQIEKKLAAPPQVLGVAETPSGGTTFAGDNFFLSPDHGVTTFSGSGVPNAKHEAPPELRPGMGLPVQFAQGLFWTGVDKKIYKYESKLKVWIQVAETPVEFRGFMPLFDGSYLLLKTLELMPDRLFHHRALVERWDGKGLQTLIPLPDRIKSTLSTHDVDGPFWDIETHEFEEFILLYDRFTGYLAVYRPEKGLKELATPWGYVPFDDFFKIQSDKRFRSEIGLQQKPGVPPEQLRVIRSRAPYPIQFIPTTPGKVLVIYKKPKPNYQEISATDSNGSSKSMEDRANPFHFYSDNTEAFELDLPTFDKFPVTVPENVEFPWWFDDKKGLISLAEALAPKINKKPEKAKTPHTGH